MVDASIYIRDTGKLKRADSSATYTRVNSGTWTELYGFTLTFDFQNDITSNDANRTDASNSHLLTFNSNEVTQTQAPRMILRGHYPLSSGTSLIQHLINFSRSKGIKQIKGGVGTITAFPECADSAIYVLFKNMNISEVYNDDTSGVAFTINLEQV
jgi:hypothetical protein